MLHSKVKCPDMLSSSSRSRSRHPQQASKVSTQSQQRLLTCIQATLRTAEEQQDPASHEREVRQQATRRIKQLGEQRRFKEAVEELASLATQGVEPDTQAATALLAACTRSRDMKMAEGVFEQLFGDFLQPDEVTFAVLLRGYGSRNPPDWQSVDAVLTRMKNTYGIEPTAVSYNALLEICYKSNDDDRALDVMDRMSDDEVEPDEILLNTVSKKRTWRTYLRKLYG